ncbi:ABC transporter ATP-binding protein [Halorientalis brevis]|uniref:Molybdate/tungstate import ATP-binding protein WtpC n=2 Tax=Halorientalis brevis TaxID=1126241 RepID=A0ABD6CBX9_9EURY|nr:ABC transporter ATP-binding protein [Halorientalis brevis]
MMLDIDVAASFSADGADRFDVAADFEVEDGETVVVLGPSGSGKTLLLETVAGFHDHTGTVRKNGTLVSDEPPETRDFGFVFQDYALFPHMTVTENVAFGTSYRESDRDPEQLLADLGVSDLQDRYPPTLSGGEQQRVALARALAVDPEVLLLDEPLSSLDVPTRQSLRADLQDVLAEVTAIYVTHDRTTARALADRIVVMNDGEVVQTGTPEAVFSQPVSPTVARFTGSNCVSLAETPELVAALGLQPTADETHAAIRPEDVILERADPDLTGTVDRVTREETASRVVLTLADSTTTIEAFDDAPPEPGSTEGISFPRDKITLL